MKRIPALDGVRGIAIFLVVCGHAVYVGGYAGHGVSLFFVLSGYLITGILLDCRVEIERGAPLLRMLGIFYLRRALRIFPAYYLMLAICLALNLDYFRSLFWWHALYADNFLMWKIKGWLGAASHLWSLGVEEQFYMLWPLIILIIPRRALLPVCLGAVGMGIISAVISSKLNPDFFGMLPSTAAIYLGMGALIVVLHRSEPKRIVMLAPLAAGGALLILCQTISDPVTFGLPYNWVAAADMLMTASLMGSTIYQASMPGIVASVLSWSPLRHLGNISYGLYLYHFPVIMAVETKWPGQPIVRAVVTVGASLTLAIVSLHFFEKPIRDLGRRFDYRRGGAKCAPT
jgi:peptidoglycan/LPS O-acetylase OafA/YrhL